MPKQKAPQVTMLADTKFWKTKGEGLFLSKKTDPTTTPITDTRVVRVRCECCGKTIRKRINRWVHGHTMCKECGEEHGTLRWGPQMLAETEFWKNKGKDLLLSTRNIDPNKVSISAGYRIQVACECCGKRMSRRLNKWCAGATLCQDCLTERREKQKAKETAKREAEAKRDFTKGTLWGDLPWQVILMWDWKKNDVAPWEIGSQSRKVIHLVCPECGFKYDKKAITFRRHFIRDASLVGSGRRATSMCECCVGNVLVRGVNDLATTHPEYAAHWHPTKNGNLTPQDVTAKYDGDVWFLYDDGTAGSSNLRQKVIGKRGFARPGANSKLRSFIPVSKTHPHLVPQWDVAKNGGFSPDDFTYGSGKVILWTCPECGYEWEAMIKSRTLMGTGCPKCALRGTSKGEDLVGAALDHLGLYYKVEKRFDSCRYKAPLPFDFAIIDEETGKVLLLIEYQGRQHEDAIDIWGGEPGLAYRKTCDQIKRDWCLLHGIPLLEIWHTDDTYQAVLSAICRKITAMMGGMAA